MFTDDGVQNMPEKFGGYILKYFQTLNYSQFQILQILKFKLLTIL